MKQPQGRRFLGVEFLHYLDDRDQQAIQRESGLALVWRRETQELICRADRLAFPVRDDIPVMLEEEARRLPPDEEV